MATKKSKVKTVLLKNLKYGNTFIFWPMLEDRPPATYLVVDPTPAGLDRDVEHQRINVPLNAVYFVNLATGELHFADHYAKVVSV